MFYLPVILMGAVSIVVQILCLRQLLSTFSGNELIIGITLASWLLLVGSGSYIGARVTFKNAFGWSFILVSLLLQPTIMLIKIIRPAAGFELGEVIPLTTTIVWTILTMAPLCITIGSQFPLAVSYLRGKSPEVYSLEAVGAFIGGILFTFLLAGHIDIYLLALILAVIYILVPVYLNMRKTVLILALLPLLLYAGGTSFLPSLQYKEVELVKRTESRYGEITVLKIKEQLNVYSSEKLQFSYPDPQSEEQTAHLPMSLHPSAEEILVVGGSPAVIRELLKYNASRIDFVEIDPVMIGVSREILNPEDRKYLDDKRVKILQTDARRYMKSPPLFKYDLIVLNIPAPSTANINRYYTIEFFKETVSALDEKGVLYLRLPVSYGYIGRRMQMANGSIYRSLKAVFPYVEVSSEEYGIIAASKSPLKTDPDLLSERFSKKRINTRHFHPYILIDAFSPLQVNMVKERLDQVKEINSDTRPVSYLYNLMLWTEIHGGKWLNLLLGLNVYKIFIVTGIILAFTTLFIVRKEGTIPYVLFTTGFITMAFSMIVILSYQAYAGYVYETIGLLTGTFMLGGAAGAYMMRRTNKTLKWLITFDIFTILLMFTAMMLMKNEPVFYVFIFLAGTIGGGQFAAAALSLMENGSQQTAGRLYAIDLAGSFLGSFSAAVFLVPLTGVRNTLIFLILIKMISFILLMRQRSA